MKTRVVAEFSQKRGCDVYRVERWADYDSINKEGDKLCITVAGYDWRIVDRLTNLGDAIAMAKRLTKGIHEPVDRVIGEFGEYE